MGRATVERLLELDDVTPTFTQPAPGSNHFSVARLAHNSTKGTHMNKHTIILLGIMTLGASFSLCGGDGPAPTPAPGPSPSPTPTPAPAPSPVPVDDSLGFSVLPDGRGGVNFEAVVITDDMNFDKARSLAAFEETLYPHLRSSGCSGCHNSDNTSGSGAQAPLHADSDVALAHEYALTRVNFRDPENSKFVVRMRLDRHNCPGSSCADAAD